MHVELKSSRLGENRKKNTQKTEIERITRKRKQNSNENQTKKDITFS